MQYAQIRLTPANPAVSFLKLALGIVLECEAPKLAPLYHGACLLTANNLTDATISSASLASSSEMRKTFGY